MSAKHLDPFAPAHAPQQPLVTPAVIPAATPAVTAGVEAYRSIEAFDRGGFGDAGGASGGSSRLGVRAVMSHRLGGVSLDPYASLNLGDHVGDDAQAVARNRQLFAQAMQAQPVWLTQVHGNRVVRLRPACGDGGSASNSVLPADTDVFVPPASAMAQPEQPRADGALTTERGLACTVMVADCLPILLAAPDGRGVAALHAGWRGLAGAGAMQGQGIVHTGVQALCEATGAEPHELLAWLGPCIGPLQFEVGADVLIGFGVQPDPVGTHPRFRLRPGRPGEPLRWLADLPGLARDILLQRGVRRVEGGQWCTVSDRSHFFSFRRDGVTGRQAAGICLR
jgi:YfiH family protein